MQDSVLALGGQDVKTLALPGSQILDPDFFLTNAGPFGSFILPVLLAVVFIESGLLFPFLPGDSLLFTAGLITRLDDPFAPLWVVLVTAPIAAFLGDQVGYWIGHKFEKPLLARPDGRIFKQAYIRESHEFFEKHGPITIIICRFVPIVRTYAPLVAGMSGMRYKTFIVYNAVGAVAWAAGVTLLGWLLGEIQFIRDHIDLILIVIVLVSVLPMIIAGTRKILARRKLAAADSVPETPVSPSNPEN